MATKEKTADERIRDFLEAPDVHNWAKDLLRQCQERDIVDVLGHLETIVEMLDQKFWADAEAARQKRKGRKSDGYGQC